MGQSTSNSTICDSISPLLTRLASDPVALLLAELMKLTFEELQEYINKLNTLAKHNIDTDESYLQFVYKIPGEEFDMFWKAKIIITCLKIDGRTNKVVSKRTFTLPQFWKVFKTIMDQYSTAEQSLNNTNASKVFQDINGVDVDSLDINTECCICFERQPDISLPCAHAYCTECIEKWKRTHDTCPLCRNTMESDEDWELTDIPNSEEIKKEIRSTFSNLTQ